MPASAIQNFHGHTLEQLGAEAGLVMLRPHRLSPNDGAISYGQAAVAAARLAT